jgi:hypothetical protein
MPKPQNTPPWIDERHLLVVFLIGLGITLYFNGP